MTLPFDAVATFDHTRRPNVAVKDDVRGWLNDNCGESQWGINWLINGRPPDRWKAYVTFQDPAKALMFKLTWAGRGVEHSA